MTTITKNQTIIVKEKYSYGYALKLYEPFKNDEEKFNYKFEKINYILFDLMGNI